jgi:spermidine synthase
MTPHARRVAPLLFLSGLCALVYQVAWLREFRLIFGASTAASAAVLAIFIGGLGLGGLLLGPRADRRASPLGFYAQLEAGIAATVALSPGLLWLVREVYQALGGSVVLGLGAGTALRLLLATLVLAVPTLLMGGTLPAAARAIETDEDARRRGVALLYGVNTLGAVVGSFVATFLLLEVMGTRLTLWLACLLNLAVAVSARAVARSLPAGAPQPARAVEGRAAPAGFVFAAAGLVGFAFFLMELVWYRMLGPVLGGSVFTFGLILTVALLGIGLGGYFYSIVGHDRPARLSGFAWTCLLEAAMLAVPYALGDRIALLALLVRPLGHLGFWGHVLGWSAVTAIVVLPAAFVAGYQFPMLVALLGRGREEVGRQIGQTYAWNTLGAIAGSLAGGFGLLPALTAPGCWRAVTGLLLALGVVSIALAWRRERRLQRLLAPVGLAVLVASLLTAHGPSAAWRHGGIGVGRVPEVASRNGAREFVQRERRALVWEADGVESSVSLSRRMGLAFVVNGKVDGHLTLDAPTQVMSGLLGALLHPAPRTAMVVGLGTGSTAGWLGVVPGMEKVDVVELEPAILEVARASATVNQDVLRNPKVHVTIGDAREVLLTTPHRYDLVFSEPSNPYRAGIASMFTAEYYRAVEQRLNPGGIFLQWMQSYEVTSEAVRTVYATLSSVYPYVETWRTHRDLLLLASREPIRHRPDELRRRIASEPYRSALASAWRVSDLEGFLGYHVARPSFARAVAASHRGPLNTDDLNVLEFGFARAVGRRGLFDLSEALDLAVARLEDRPAVPDGEVDWDRVTGARLRLYGGSVGSVWAAASAATQQRAWAVTHHLRGESAAALQAWRAQVAEPSAPIELALVAEGLAEAADERAVGYLESLRAFQPAEADALLGLLRARQGRVDEAAARLSAAFERHRTDPWPRVELMLRALTTAKALAAGQPALATRLLEALSEPFAAGSIDEERLLARFEIAAAAGLAAPCARAAHALEPWVPWRRDFLSQRYACYVAARDAGAGVARDELTAFLRDEPVPLAAGIETTPVGGTAPAAANSR